MPFNPATDFIGLWRNSAGNVSKLEMPGLDYVVTALARSGLVTVTASATAPGANQSTTAWLKTVVPDWSAEGSLYLWDATAGAYAPATPSLFFAYLEACAGVSGISWWTTTGGEPLNTVGHDGDYAIRTDDPGGVYGPKVAGAWPSAPLPGTSNVIESSALDNAFGSNPGNLIYRSATEWDALSIGTANMILTVAAGLPVWEDLSELLDALFGNLQGSILYRGASAWDALPPSTENFVLTTHGDAVNPSWTPKSSEFGTGTVMVFRQSAAPTGWVKQTGIDNYGLRVVAGDIGTTTASPFSTVFSQSTVGGTSITIAQMPSHHHVYDRTTVVGGGGGFAASGGAYTTIFTPTQTDDLGGGQVHSHSINLSLSYLDVIIATKG